MLYLRQVAQILKTIGHIWQDSRVPLLARMFVVLAPLYWLNPFDLIPDLQPGGYNDDLMLFCLLVAMAFCLVPGEVFRDASKAAQLGRKAALFGMLYVTVAGAIPCKAHATEISQLSAYRYQQQISASRSVFVQGKQQSTQAEAKVCSHDNQLIKLGDFSGSQHGPISCEPYRLVVMASTVSNGLAVVSKGPPMLLITRGGQYQFYAFANSSVARLAAHPRLTSTEMPQRSARGIFAARTSLKMSLLGEELC